MKINNKLFFTRTLLDWNRDLNTRSMPWKGEKDPYKIWLSEIMLQQTRVEQGREYYLRFVQAFPSIRELAAAPDDQVFKLWEGLGYYSRCRNLLATARHISTELSGIFPSTYPEILQLKGVGPYTAAAIASFGYGLPHGVVDGNVNRVLARFFGISTPTDSTEGKKQFFLLAQELLDKKEPATYNQAIMDFGAIICRPKSPLCIDCPLNTGCAAFQTGQVEKLPVKAKKPVKKDRWFYYVVVNKNAQYLIRRRESKDIWQHLYEFILIEQPGRMSMEELLRSKEFRLGLPFETGSFQVSVEYRQQLTHQTIHAVFLETTVEDMPVAEGFEAVSRDALTTRAFPRLLNHFLEDKGWK